MPLKSKFVCTSLRSNVALGWRDAKLATIRNIVPCLPAFSVNYSYSIAFPFPSPPLPLPLPLRGGGDGDGDGDGEGEAR